MFQGEVVRSEYEGRVRFFIIGIVIGALVSGAVFWGISGGAGYGDADRVAEQLKSVEQEHRRTVDDLTAVIEQQRREAGHLRRNIAEARGLVADAGRVCESIAGANRTEAELIDAAIEIATKVYSALQSIDGVLGGSGASGSGTGDLGGL